MGIPSPRIGLRLLPGGWLRCRIGNLCGRVPLGTPSALSRFGAQGTDMRHLQIKSTAATDKPGDLRASLKGGKILLPERVVSALAPLGIHTAIDLVVYFDSFPSTVADELG